MPTASYQQRLTGGVFGSLTDRFWPIGDNPIHPAIDPLRRAH
jgi:hypothetical protein